MSALFFATERTIESLDISAIIVAIFTGLGAVVVAFLQYKGKLEEKGKREKAETVAQQAGVSETAMANVAEKSLELLQSLLDNERKENAALHELLAATQERLQGEILDKNNIISSLNQQVIAKDNKIKELETELSRLRGRMDQILNREDESYGRS